MSGIFRVEYADIARSTGFKVIEHGNWRARARSNNTGGYADKSRPWGVMWHHTASPASWNGKKDADYIAEGSDVRPVANFYIDRQGTIWVIAAGCTNTNGSGGPMKWSKGTVPNDSMNSYACGVEMGNNGVGEIWPQVQVDAMFALSNAINKAFGNLPEDLATHRSWTTRKIDPATASAVQGPWRPRSENSSGTWNVSDIRAEAKRRAQAAPQPPQPPQEDDDMVIEVRINGANAAFLGIEGGPPTRGILWMEWVNGANPKQLARLEAYRKLGVPFRTINIEDLMGVGLLGPVPHGDDKHDWTGNEFGSLIT